MKLNKKSLNLLLVIVSFFVFSALVSGVGGAGADNVTVVIPASAGTMSGNAVFNCSLQAGYEAENWTRVRVSFQSSSLTANTTETAFTSWILNSTSYAFNGTVSTTVIEDANDYTFKCQIWNGTNYINKTRSGITIGNTVPNTPTSLTPTSVTQTVITNAISFSSTVGGVNTTSCTLFFDGTNPGLSSYTMTHSGNNCSYTFSSGISPQSYIWYIRASDETNTTDSSTKTTEIRLQKGSSSTIYEAEKQGLIDLEKDERTGTLSIVDNNTFQNSWIWIVLVIVVIIVIVIIRKR